jgi:outer membrane protein assembly factor BamB
MGDRFRGWDGGYAVAPDGKTYFAGGPGGSFMLVDVEKGIYRTVTEQASAVGFYERVRAPAFVSAARFSPDGKFVAYTVAHYPTSYGGMMGPPPNPFSTGVRLVKVDTGEVVWRRDVETMDDSSLAAAGECLAVSDGGSRVCFIDWDQNAVVLGDGGKELFRKPLFEWKAKYDYRSNPAPLRVELTPDGSTILFASDGHVLMTDGDGAEVAKFTVATMSDVRLAPDGSKVYAAELDGLVTCFGRAGEKLWEMQTQGERPRLAATRAGVIVAEGAGNFFHLASDGSVTVKTSFMNAKAEKVEWVDRPIGGPPLYREPQTLAVLKQLGGAKQLAAWEPAGDGTQRFGRTFYPAAAPLKLTASGAAGAGRQYLVRLVYRHGGKGAGVTLDNGRSRRTFTLDLPTPEYRVVDLPHDGGDTLNVTVAPADGETSLEVAELSVHGFSFPGNNGLYVQPADVALERTEGLDVAGGDDEEPSNPLDAGVLDDEDSAAVAGAASGRMKNAAIFANNPDPDQVEGHYLRATGNALDSLDGLRFADGPKPPSAWTNGRKGEFGSRLVIELPYVSKAKLAATYERTLIQSEVLKGLAVLRGKKEDLVLTTYPAGPDQLAAERRVLGGLIDNDQFFNVFPTAGVEMDAFGVYVFSGRGKDHGLSEVELYE